MARICFAKHGAWPAEAKYKTRTVRKTRSPQRRVHRQQHKLLKKGQYMTLFAQRNLSINQKKTTNNSHTCLKVCFAVSLISATQLAIADAINCGTPPSTTRIKLAGLEVRPAECLQDPGWFDVGAGFAVIQKANSLGESASGNLVTLRAYPFGRWYAPLKSVSQASTDKISANLAVLRAKTDQAEQKKKFKEENPINISAQQEADKTQQEADKAANDVAMSMQAALNDFGSMYAVQGESEGSSYLLRRISFFYGRSIGGFDTKVVQGDINAFGVAYDIAPQFSVIWGRAYYNQAAQNGITKTSASNNFFGIQLNLNAFKTMRNITGSM